MCLVRRACKPRSVHSHAYSVSGELEAASITKLVASKPPYSTSTDTLAALLRILARSSRPLTSSRATSSSALARLLLISVVGEVRSGGEGGSERRLFADTTD